jgi:hypothetical protein
MSERQASWKMTYEVHKWAGMESFLKDEAFKLDLELSLQNEKGWLFERGRFKVNGPVSKVREFRYRVNESIRRFNQSGGK